MLILEKEKRSHGACELQRMAAATLYRLVPVIFSQRMSVMGMRELSQPR